MNIVKDENWFVEQILKNQGIIHKICTLYACNKHDKEDLYQEIVLQLWKSYNSFEGKSKFSTWMYRVALNTALTINRKTNCEFANEDISLRIIESTQADNSQENSQITTLYKAIGKLKKIDRALIMLYLDDKSYDEIAEVIGISVKNVSVKLVRIKRKLEKIFISITD